jgi:hypothetical protein
MSRAICGRGSFLIQVANEDGVARVSATREGERTTIASVSEVIDQIGLEVGDLHRPAAVQRLPPEVRYTA